MQAVPLKPMVEYAECRSSRPSHCRRTIATTIGRELRNYYDLSSPLPDLLRELLKQLDDCGVKADGSTGAPR